MKIFTLYDPKWAFFTPEQMFDEEAKLRSAHKHYLNADLYMLTKMNKVLFNPKKTKVTFGGDLSVEILVGNSEKKRFDKKRVRLPLIFTIYGFPSIKEKYKSIDLCFSMLLYERYKPSSEFKVKALSLAKIIHQHKLVSDRCLDRVIKFIYSTEVKVAHRNPYEINIFEPLLACMTDNDKAEQERKRNPKDYEMNNANWEQSKLKEVDFDKLPNFLEGYNSAYKIDQIVNYSELDVGGQEIVYIGKTEQEDFNRLSSHDKVNKINALHLRDEYKSNVIHLLGFKYCETIGSINRESNVKKSDAISTAEASLINYFKPHYNTHYVKNEGSRTWSHRVLLREKKFTHINLHFNVKGQYTKFFTKHLGHQGNNSYEIKFRI
ncbi:hypothetical protein P3709_24080 [Vibrio parahaemolyticus]|uniref:hypothetical protein n=1 Tax=Vibrio parahaemolyticus TaxID=670 RepID=UPI00047097BC|nr:hypothetical protein [Vibrio parahaemolyticus]MCI4896597.1 hypothetical protein [Vibrio parahaemolyticus]MCR9790196.1 hypothetical protein [Vibrio parahaemolyticus]MCR9828723.1 hypothetical protein [Vibrio parahaemolyticus]MDF4961795.1 hypothetical protein [Vibrio parahaemolyticus]MDF5178553.1 hypothetical protein [Vibrio parahaemolyticus]